MLGGCGLTKKKVNVFEGFQAFSGFIAAEDDQKLLEKSKLFSRGYRTFAEYSPGQLKNARAWFEPGFPGTAQLKPMEKSLGRLEICRGNFLAPQEIPVAPEIDGRGFKRESFLKGQSPVSLLQFSPPSQKRKF
jgi:hypothetical protein